MVHMDLGLIVSQDGLHYREPIADFPIVSAAEDSWRPLPDSPDLAKFPALMQGQDLKIVVMRHFSGMPPGRSRKVTASESRLGHETDSVFSKLTPTDP